MPAPDDDELPVAGRRGRLGQPPYLGDDRLRTQLDLPPPGAERLRQPRLQRAQVEAVWVVAQPSQRQPAGRPAEPVAVRSRTQPQIQDAGGEKLATLRTEKL